jgi:hypothetical protein
MNQHEQLRDAVIDAARKLLQMRTEWADAGGDALDDEMPEECVEQVDEVCDAIAALEAHEDEQVSR